MLLNIVLGCIVLLAFPLKIFAFEATPIIKTTHGPVQGEKLYTAWDKKLYYSFKGIPYATPPVGPLRFKPPREAKPWNDVLNATVEGNKCPQIDFILSHYTGNEDCLYLNVYSPQDDVTAQSSEKKLKPVMFWIYGGAFSSGYGNSDLYGPDFLLDEDVVVVTINYRLGALGFLSLGHPNISGNAGLKDQNLALRWVQKNIEKFGGDPKQVTIFGQSAGAVSVGFHELSEMSEGLYQRSIAMSGSVLCPWGFLLPKVAEERAFNLGSKIGCNTSDKEELIRCFEKTPAEVLVKNQNITIALPPFTPTLEGPNVLPKKDTFMTKCSMKKYTSGNFTKMPRIMGYLSDEALSYAKPLTKLLEYLDSGLSIVDSVGSTSIPMEGFHSKSWISPLTGEVKNLSTDSFYDLVEVTTELGFIAEIDLTQQLMSKYNGYPIYYYKLDYDTKYALHKILYKIDYNGTGHGDDLPFIFNTKILGIPTDQNLPINQFRKKMVRLWTNFAKFANPTPDGANDTILNVVWPDSRPEGKQLIIGEHLTVADRQVNARTKLIETGVRIAAPTYTGCTNGILSSAASIIKNILS